MQKEFIEIGKIVGIHGVHGTVKLEPWCDSAKEAAAFDNYYLGESRDKVLKKTRSAVQKNMVRLWLEGIDTVEKANALRGKVLFVLREDLQLEDGKYLICDIIGCKAVDNESNMEYGIVSDVFNTGANDIWEITNNGKSYLVPVIESVLKKVDIENKTVYITPMKGIFDED